MGSKKKISIRDYLIFTTLNPESGYYEYISDYMKDLLDKIDKTTHGKATFYHINGDVKFLKNNNENIVWVNTDFMDIYEDVYNYISSENKFINTPDEIYSQLFSEYFNENVMIKKATINILISGIIYQYLNMIFK